MIPDPIQVMNERDVKLISKSDSRLMRAANWLLFWNDDFMTSFWTTVTLPGLRVIYYPTDMMELFAKHSDHTLWHELEHVKQADGPVRWLRWPWNIAFNLLYLLAWFPVGLAYFRMRWETDAYAVGYLSRVRGKDMRHTLDEYATWVADALFTSYGWTWPKSWTKARFLRKVAELQEKTQ